jgi:hypothetical protein
VGCPRVDGRDKFVIRVQSNVLQDKVVPHYNPAGEVQATFLDHVTDFGELFSPDAKIRLIRSNEGKRSLRTAVRSLGASFEGACM